MAVYVDEAIWPWRGTLWCHLLADDLDELHLFARRLGMERHWFQHPPKASSPHYDLSIGKRAQAIQLGAVPLDRRTTVIKARALRVLWVEQHPTPPRGVEVAASSSVHRAPKPPVQVPPDADGDVPRRSMFPRPGHRR